MERETVVVVLSSLNVAPFQDSMSLCSLSSVVPYTVSFSFRSPMTRQYLSLPEPPSRRLVMSLYLVNEVQLSRFRVSTICPDM